jgi:hypothetical protein
MQQSAPLETVLLTWDTVVRVTALLEAVKFSHQVDEISYVTSICGRDDALVLFSSPVRLRNYSLRGTHGPANNDHGRTILFLM